MDQMGTKRPFAAEIELLSKGRPVLYTSRIAGLDLQLVNGVLRVGRRIDQVEISWGAKDPTMSHISS